MSTKVLPELLNLTYASDPSVFALPKTVWQYPGVQQGEYHDIVGH